MVVFLFEIWYTGSAEELQCMFNVQHKRCINVFCVKSVLWYVSLLRI